MRVLHLSDLHLDTPYSNRSKDLRDQLRSASSTALAAAFDHAIQESLAAVVVAGDLFDGSALSFATERQLIAEIVRLEAAGIPLLYCTGNHDPAGQGRGPRWPSNVTIFDTEKPCEVDVETTAGTLRVTGAGHQSARCGTNLAALFPVQTPDPQIPHIALLHAQIESAIHNERHDRYAPATREDLEGKGYSYWALGHVHERQQVHDDPPAWYPGIPQGRTPKEAGVRGANVVTFTGREVSNVEFLPLSPLVWHTISLSTIRCTDIGAAETFTDLVKAVRKNCKGARFPGGAKQLLLRIQLVGPSPLHRELCDLENRETIADELRDALGTTKRSIVDLEVDVSGLHRAVDTSHLITRNDVLGEALRLLAAAHDDDQLLLDLAPKTLAMGKATPEQLRELLQDADTELIEALLQVDP